MAAIIELTLQENAASYLLNDSVGDNDGTATNYTSALATTGPGGDYLSAIHLDTLKNISLFEPIEINYNEAATLRICAKRDNRNASHGLFCSNSFSHISFQEATDNLFIFDEELNVLSINTGVDTREFHVYTIIFQTDGVCKLYVDGALVGSFSGTRTHDVIISIIGDGLSANFSGDIAGFKIYDEVLSASLILSDANQFETEETPMPSVEGESIFVINSNYVNRRRVIVRKGAPANDTVQDGVFTGEVVQEADLAGLYAGRFDDYLSYPYYGT